MSSIRSFSIQRCLHFKTNPAGLREQNDAKDPLRTFRNLRQKVRKTLSRLRITERKGLYKNYEYRLVTNLPSGDIGGGMRQKSEHARDGWGKTSFAGSPRRDAKDRRCSDLGEEFGGFAGYRVIVPKGAESMVAKLA